MSFIALMLVAMLAGLIEYVIMRQGFVSPEPRIFDNSISIKYHLPMWASWGLTCIIAGHFWAIGIFALVQDISWYFFNKSEGLSKDDWVAMKWGGFNLPWNGQFIPWTYIALAAVSLILFILT